MLASLTGGRGAARLVVRDTPTDVSVLDYAPPVVVDR